MSAVASAINFFSPKKMAPITILMFTLSTLGACSKKPELTKIQGFAQGTTYNLTFLMPADADQLKIEQAVSAEFARIDAALSNYRDDSAIEQFNAQETTEVLNADAELVALITIARDVHRASKGCYDLTIKPLFDLWGFKKDVFSAPAEDVLAETLSKIGLDQLETVSATQLRKRIPQLRVDVSSIGQGYSVSQVVKILEQFGVQNYLVEIGGELQIKGKKTDGSPWRIALEKPLPNERKLQKIVSFDSGHPMALMTSGTYRHYFDHEGKRYSHILDARNGKPVEHNTVSVTVLHSDPTLADAWSTALLCLGSNEGTDIANAQGIAALFIDQQEQELLESSSKPLQEITGISFPAE